MELLFARSPGRGERAHAPNISIAVAAGAGGSFLERAAAVATRLSALEEAIRSLSRGCPMSRS